MKFTTMDNSIDKEEFSGLANPDIDNINIILNYSNQRAINDIINSECQWHDVDRLAKKILSHEEDELEYKNFLESHLNEIDSGADFVKDTRVKDRSLKKYFVFYLSNNSEREVSKKTFSKVKGKILIRNNTYLKIIAEIGKRKETQKRIKNHYQANSLIKGFTSVINGLGLLGKISDTVSKINEGMVLDLSVLILSIIQSIEKGLDVSQLVIILISLYKCWKNYNYYETNSLDGLVFATISKFLPESLFEIIKRINLFSNIKILDNPASFYDVIYLVFDYITQFLKMINIPLLNTIVNPVLTFIESKVLYIKLKNLARIATDVLKNPKLAMKKDLRINFRVSKDEVLNDVTVIEWAKRSATIKKYIDDITRTTKVLDSYENAFRIEPVCFVFEGKPGLLKSVYMNGLIEASKESCYYHSIKCKQDGKDWYDSYNYERLFCMDDVGAQGISQWRTIVNMVSPVKLPLECAEVSLKDTKFFSSDAILVTTNNFSNLQGLTKDDGITEITALWRRGQVFEFNVERDEGRLEGNISFKHYDTKRGTFAYRFPPSFLTMCSELKIFIPVKCELSFKDDPKIQRAKLIAWMRDIVRVFLMVKKKERCANDISEEDIDSFSSVSEALYNGNTLEATMRMIPDFYDVLESSTTQAEERVDRSMTPANSEITPLDNSNDTSGLLNLIIDNVYFEHSDDSDDESNSDYHEIPNYTIPEIKALDPEYTYPRTEEVEVFEVVEEECQTMLSRVLEHLYYNPMHSMLCISVLLVIGGVLTWKLITKAKAPIDIIRYDANIGHPTIGFLSSKVYDCDYMINNRKGSVIRGSHGFISGHCLVTVYHLIADAINDRVVTTVYNDRDSNSILLDKLTFRVVYKNIEEDVCVLQCETSIATPFRNLHKHIVDANTKTIKIARNAHLIIPRGSIKVSSIFINEDLRITYANEESGYKNENASILSYKDYFGRGKCGALIVDSVFGILGMHVAGHELSGKGASILWSLDTKKKIRHILEMDKRFIIDCNISDKIIPNFSGIKVDLNYHISAPTSQNISHSKLHGIFPNTKEPADLLKYGRHTVKEIAKKSFKPLKDVSHKDIEFSENYLNSIIPFFKDLTEEEVVGGDDFLAPLNKDSSNGYGCLKEKSDYIDFPSKKFKENFKEELAHLEQAIITGDLKIEDFLSTETLKTELRSISKDKTPRSFRISRVHIQVLTKMVCGDLARQLIKFNNFLGLAIGANPIKSWPLYYDELQKCDGRHWAGDISNFDGGMLSQIQEIVNEVVISKYRGKKKEVIKFVLYNAIYCWVAMNDDVFIANHSMPSGIYVTSLFDSLVNKCYIAMWYRRYTLDRTVIDFHSDIFSVVLGDDMIVGVRNSSLLSLDAESMRDFFESIGLGYTTAKKEPITQPYEKIEDIDFLKRKFRFHPVLAQIVCPLDLGTILTSIQWYDNTKDHDQVLADKMHSFQREAYLHYYLFEHLVDELEKACKERSISFVRLPESYLIALYSKEPDKCLFNFNNAKYL